MTPLVDQTCLKDEQLQKLSDTENHQLLTQIPGWFRQSNHLIRRWQFPDYKQALKFVNKIGALADKQDHHPEISFTWGRVDVLLTTHAVEGLSQNDYILAAKINQLLS